MVKLGLSVIVEGVKTPVLSKMQVPEGGEQEARVDVPDRGSGAEHSRGGESMRGRFRNIHDHDFLREMTKLNMENNMSDQ